MTRSVAFAGAVALVLARPIVALAAPTGFMPAFHPVYRPAPAPASRESSDTQAPFKVPFDVNAHPKSQFLPEATWYPFRWHGWQPNPGSLYYRPLWYQPCAPNDVGWVPSATVTAPLGASAPAADFTIGSLVDGQSSNIFGSSPSDIARVAGSSNDGAATSSPLTLEYGVGSAPCATANPFGF